VEKVIATAIPNALANNLFFISVPSSDVKKCYETFCFLVNRTLFAPPGAMVRFWLLVGRMTFCMVPASNRTANTRIAHLGSAGRIPALPGNVNFSHTGIAPVC
jgi:hypothetical protein